MRPTSSARILLITTALFVAQAAGAAPTADVSIRGADRKDGLTIVTAPSLPADAESAELIAALRAAKRAGDEAAVMALHDALGWAPGSSTAPVDCARVERAGMRSGPRRWQEDVLVTDPQWSSGKPAMTTEANGRVWIAVEDLNGNYIDIYFSDTDGLTWTYYFSLYGIARDLTYPSILIGQGNTKRLLVAYEYGRGTTDAAIHVYWEDLVTHDSATVLVEVAQMVAHPQLCADCPEAGYWYPYLTYVRGIIAEREDFSNVVFTRSLDYGTSWTTPVTLVSQGTRDSKPDIDYGGIGLYMVYTQTYTTGDRDTYVRRSTNYGSTWSDATTLGYSSFDEYAPRVAATYGGGAAVVAYERWWSPTIIDIHAYYTTDAGDHWTFGPLPEVPDTQVSRGVDLCASFENGSIHAAFVNDQNIYYTRADHTDPSAWTPLEIVNDGQTALFTERVTVAANPHREVDECVAWSDARLGGNQAVFFDSGYPLGQYIIIDGTNSMAGALAPLIEWKRSLGYDVLYVTRAQIFDVYTGGDDGERFWGFLHDQRDEVRYVLLVGSIAQIPFRILYPDGDPGHSGGYGSDYYYAQLSMLDWDLDEDWRWGEFYDDELNFFPDALVGRIPFDTTADVAAIAQNIVAYEQDTGAWKKNMLLACGFANHVEPTRAETDFAWASAHTIVDFLQPTGWSYTTLYERGGINPSDYPSDAALNQANFELYAGLQQQGVISCMAHGGTGGMAGYQWAVDLGNDGVVTSHDEYEDSSFNEREDVAADPISALVGLWGCSTGILFGNEPAFAQSGLRSRYLYTIQHDWTTHLELLKSGAPAVIGTSAGSDYEPGWTHHTHGRTASLSHYFHYFLISHRMRAGDAFYAAMLYYVQVHIPERGIRDFNYLGDPSLEVEGVGSRRWRSNGFAVAGLPAEGPFLARDAHGEPPPRQRSARDDDTTIWWKSGEIEDARVTGAILGAADGSIYVGADRYVRDSGWRGTVYRSVNGGETWDEAGGLADCYTISSLVQTDTGTLIAGGLVHVTEQWFGAIYRSVDEGDSWSRIHTFYDGKVLDIAKAANGDLWAATGWDGAIYRSVNDGVTWALQSSLGSGVFVYSIMQASTGRFFVTLGGPGSTDKVMWSDNGTTWVAAAGLGDVSTAYDLVESCGALWVGVAMPWGGAIFGSDLGGEVWTETAPLTDDRITAIRSLCAGPDCLTFAGVEMEPGPSESMVLAWDADAGEWYIYGGAIDSARRIHALHVASGLVFAGTGDEYGNIYQHILPAGSSVDERDGRRVPAGLRCSHTNPARNGVEIRLSLPEPSPLTARVYDASGRLVRTLLHNAATGAGAHTLVWDGRDDHGRSVPAGVYTYRMATDQLRAQKRVVLLR